MNANRFLILIAVSLLLLSTTACDGCGDDPAEVEADERIETLASLLPATSEAAVVVPELEELPDTLDKLFARGEHFNPDIRARERDINQTFGFRITDPESWEAAGFDLDGSAVFSMVGARPVLATYIDDQNAFETTVIGQLRNNFGAGSPIDDQTYGERSFRLSAGEGPANDMAWYVDDSIVVLIMPPFDALDVFETGSASSVANKLGHLDEDATLAKSKAFGEFRRGLGNDYPLSIYFHAERYFEHPDIDEDAIGVTGVDTLAHSLLEWSEANTNGAGLGLRADERRIKVHGFAGADDDVLAEAKEAYATEEDVDWGGMLTENTTLALRTAVDLPATVETYLDNLPDDERRTIERDLAQMGRNHELDINDDVIGAFSGHALVVFYGVGGDISEAVGHLMNQRFMPGSRAVLQNSGLLANLHFTDEDKKDRLLDHLTGFAGDGINRRALNYDGDDVDDIEIFETAQGSPFDVPIRLYSGDRSVTLGTAGINEGSTYEYLTNRRDEPALVDAEDRELGARFAGSENINGIYLNFNNLQGNIQTIGPPISGFANVLNPLDELLVEAGVDDDGFYTTGEMTFSQLLEDDDE